MRTRSCRPLAASLASLVCLALAPTAGAEAPATPLDADALGRTCSATCLAYSAADDALLCLDGVSSDTCRECAAAFFTARDESTGWQWFMQCNEDQTQRVDRAAIAAVNARLARGGYAAVTPLWSSGPIAAGTNFPDHAFPDGTIVAKEGDRVVVKYRSFGIIDQAEWRLAPKVGDAYPPTTLTLYALGADHLVGVFEYANPRFVVRERRHVVLRRGPPTPAPTSKPPIIP